ncbi:MAG: polyprenyl synthetase family protein [Rhodobacteraceae bacterium]|nr:polyprenyl synthetase family protein [Paracoccaceae bacterium]
MTFQDQLALARDRIDNHLTASLSWLQGRDLHDAMWYALTGGKRIRGFLALESACLFGIHDRRPLHAAAAIECIHAYSLIHDDLPCMDNDSERRGKPTVHIKFGEATAVLSGDALQSLAFEILADPGTSPDAEIRSRLIATLAHACGARGMVLGQAMDISTPADAAPSLDEVFLLQSKKTGALISWAAEAGALLAGEDPQPLGNFARALGILYQITDDLLDVADAESSNLVQHFGERDARSEAVRLKEDACDALACYRDRADGLRELAQFVLERNY